MAELPKVPCRVCVAPQGVSIDELAARLFVKLYDPANGRTPQYCANKALDAAEAFAGAVSERRG